MIGQTLGHYKIVDKLGAGGMGEVYRAEDSTLGREVAIKVLPEAFTSDPERLARFEREAKLLASLNHPHIAQIHALEDVDGQKLLVMELVEGDTLADHITQGPVPLESALSLACQIAEALEAAHERGMVHRDLKPANIKLTPDGEIKVLDFGLAKPITDPATSDLTHSPTLTYSPTHAGVLLGTAAYMSPEQARGQEVDKRTDIWAFGVVLWEMLTGKHLFEGETLSDILAAVLRADPDWQELPNGAPSAVHRLLRRCLMRDPKDRLHDIADARLELEETIGQPELTAEAPAQQIAAREHSTSRIFGVLAGIGLAAILGMAGWLWLRPEPDPIQIQRFQLNPPSGVALTELGASANLALSPDGKWVAFTGHRTDLSTSPQLYLRSMGKLDAHPVPGTEGARNPFFSPDSRWLGFAADDMLMKVPVEGGEAFPICAVSHLRGASWGEDGTILFAAADRSLRRVSADGGEPETVTVPNSDQGELSHRWPQFLPGGREAIFLVRTGPREDKGRISVVSLDTGEYRTLLTGGTYPRYVHTGHLLYSRLGVLHAVSFDVDRPGVTGRPRRVLEDLHYYYSSGIVAYDVSESGSMVFVPGAPRVVDRQLVWVDRQGNIEPLTESGRPFVGKPALSPDRSHLVVQIAASIEDSDIWIYEMERENWTRMTFQGGMTPLWSPDGKWIVFSSNRGGPIQLFRVAADGSGGVEQLTFSFLWDSADSFSPDGSMLAFSRQVRPSDFDVFMLPLEGERTPQPFLATTDSEGSPVFSPNGEWIAYSSDKSGQSEIYLRPYPGPGSTVKVSTNGGNFPAWNPNGQELFYWGLDDTVWAVPIGTVPEFTVGKPGLLFRAERMGSLGVSADGQRFLTVRSLEEATPDRQIVYVPNWTDEVAQLMQQR